VEAFNMIKHPNFALLAVTNYSLFDSKKNLTGKPGQVDST
jgi:hypothetical protein